MRVSTLSTYLTTAQGLGEALSRVQQEQGRVASGKTLTRWSDDAAAAASAERYRAQEADWSSYRRTATDAKSWLGAADGALQSMSSLLRRVRDLTVSAQNGAVSDTARGAIADEITQLRGQMQDLANTQYLGRGVFAGFGSRAVTQDAVTGTWQFAGDSGQVLRQVSPDVTVQVNVDGAKLLGFSGGGPDVFTTLDNVAANIRAGAPAPGDVIAIDNHIGAVGAALGTIGATENRVEGASSLGDSTVQNLRSERSQFEDADLAETIMNLNQAKIGYSAAVGAAGQANLPSLADYLR
jgi:flagellar hook-associated protein 3 FlgL